MADQEQINNLLSVAAFMFWHALVQGHPKTPYCLSGCFENGLGVVEDDYVATLLFGVALELGDPRCQNKIKNIQVPSSMNETITGIVGLIKEVQQNIDPNAEMNVNYFGKQLLVFDSIVNLPHLPVLVTT